MNANKEKEKALCMEMAGWLYEKNARNIVLLDVSGKTIVADYFLVASGLTTVTVRALHEELEKKLKEKNIPVRAEGFRDARWIILEVEGTLVHLMREEDRDFYRLERLWSNGENMVTYSDELHAANKA